MKKINLMIKNILKKKFSTELYGYNTSEVDQFLDLIIKDYEIYKDEIEILEEKLNEKNDMIETRNDKIKTLEFENENLKIQLKESSKASNYAILKEIKNLKKYINPKKS